jgi:glycosyltransferase EpsF
MISVLIVTENDLVSQGGIQTGIRRITTRLKDNFVFDCIVFQPMQENEKTLFPQFRNIFCIPCEKKIGVKKIFENITRPVRIYRSALSIMKSHDYSAVHCHDIQKGGIVLLAARKTGVSIRIAHSHNPATTDPKSFVQAKYYEFTRKLVSPNSNVKIGCSMKANEYMFGNEANKSRVVNNEILLDKFKRTDKTLGHRFIHIGRFTHQKNHAFIIDTFSEILRRIPDATLTLVGWGEKREEIINQIAEFGLSKAVAILPNDSNVLELLNSSDYMIFPSRYEGLGRVLIEAQAMEVMCFASDVVPRETDLGLCVYLPLENGCKKWADIICDFIDMNQRENYKLENNRVKEFDINNIVDKYAAIYRGEWNE